MYEKLGGGCREEGRVKENGKTAGVAPEGGQPPSHRPHPVDTDCCRMHNNPSESCQDGVKTLKTLPLSVGASCHCKV